MIYKRKPYLSVLNDWLHVEVWYIDIIWSLNLEGKGAGGPITTISLGIKLKIDDCVLGWRGGGGMGMSPAISLSRGRVKLQRKYRDWLIGLLILVEPRHSTLYPHYQCTLYIVCRINSFKYKLLRHSLPDKRKYNSKVVRFYRFVFYNF